MLNITLISTVHEEKGICTSQELVRILEKINPEVIFEEIPPSFFDAYYKDQSRNNLETRAINEYLKNHPIKHIPVDCYDIPFKFFEDNAYLHKKIEAISREYKKVMDAHSIYVENYGFKYLNSIYCSSFNTEIYSTIESAIKKISDNKLLQMFESWNNVNSKREREMLNNIYNHCKEYEYNIGVFFIGAGHRKSIITLIEKEVINATLKINWNYSKYDNIL